MRRHSMQLNAAIFGIGLLASVHAQAQTTVIGSGEKKTITGSTAGPVNPTLVSSPMETDVSGMSYFQIRDLLNYKVEAKDGPFGQVVDAVFDRNGNIQFLLANHDGKIIPLPCTPGVFSGRNKTLTYGVTTSALIPLEIDPLKLPTMGNKAFVQRMQQVFGPTFGANPNQRTSAYPPVNEEATVGVEGRATGRSGKGVPTFSGRMEKGATRPTGAGLNIDGGVQPAPGGLGSGTSAAGALNGAAAGGAPGSTGGTKGSAGGAPDKTTGAGTNDTGSGSKTGSSGSGSY